MLFTVFGILTVVWPEVTVAVLIVVFGAFMLVEGTLAAIVSLFERGAPLRWVVFFGGLMSAGLGVAVLAWPDVTALILLYLVAGWAVAAGLVLLVLGLALRGTGFEWRGWLAGGGVVSLAFGVALFVWPEATAVTVTWLIGAWAIVLGILLVILGFRVRSLMLVKSY